MARTITIFSLFLILFSGSYPALAASDELESTLADQESVAVTIYNDNLALIKDSRRITLPVGVDRLAFKEVSARLQPETAIMRSVSHGEALRVLEQNFDFDLLTPQKLLEKYVGREVGVVKTHPTTGEETVEQATVLSTNNGVVLRIGDRIETGNAGRLVFHDVPANLRDRPTLTMTLKNTIAEPQTVELSYLTGGLSWQADYVAELAGDENSFDINGWVTLTNTSGTGYHQALLQLVAGEVHQPPELKKTPHPLQATDRMMMGAAPEMAEEGLFEYHLYTLERPTDILDNQSKQVALLQAAQVPAVKEYVLQGQPYYYQSRFNETAPQPKVGVFLTFVNTRDNHLGMPLPKGVVRVYKKDSNNRVQFIGADRIDHTPENETVRLMLGNAFDVTAERKQTDFKKLAGFARYNYVFESSFEVRLKNAKEQPVTIKVVEPLPGDWEILTENLPHTKETAAAAIWRVAVPAKGETTLTYSVRVRL
jgi:hypothetical protein